MYRNYSISLHAYACIRMYVNVYVCSIDDKHIARQAIYGTVVYVRLVGLSKTNQVA